jgi:hypothetical protein
MARPNVVRSQPVSASIGSWKKPMAERGPKDRSAISDPAMMISQGKDGTAGAGRVSDMVALLKCAATLGISTHSTSAFD